MGARSEATEVPIPKVETEWHTEWAVEITWKDWKKAGAHGPTSQYASFDTKEACDTFVDMQRRDPDVAATRVLSRRAAYTAWEGPEPDPTTEADREARLRDYYERTFPNLNRKA